MAHQSQSLPTCALVIIHATHTHSPTRPARRDEGASTQQVLDQARRGCKEGGDAAEKGGQGGRSAHLQLLHLARPAAALLAVDAADGQRQDLLLQLRVRVDLETHVDTRTVKGRLQGHPKP